MLYILRMCTMTFIVVAFTGCSVEGRKQQSQSQKQSLPQAQQVAAENPRSIEGVYELISDTINLSDPKQKSDSRVREEWTGLWLFHGGHFSQTLMKMRRPGWSSGLPNNPHEIGFDSTAGSYELISDSIELKISMSFFPEEVGRIQRFDYQFDGVTLILTETLHLTKESLSKGQRIIVLRRV